MDILVEWMAILCSGRESSDWFFLNTSESDWKAGLCPVGRGGCSGWMAATRVLGLSVKSLRFCMNTSETGWEAAGISWEFSSTNTWGQAWVRVGLRSDGSIGSLATVRSSSLSLGSPGSWSFRLSNCYKVALKKLGDKKEGEKSNLPLLWWEKSPTSGVWIWLSSLMGCRGLLWQIIYVDKPNHFEVLELC